MSTVADYVGRTIDHAAFQGQVPRGEVRLDQVLAEEGTGGRITTGINKLGQRFLIHLLTDTGTLLYRPNEGSTFMIEARQGLIRTTADLLSALSRALVDVKINMQAEESDTDPDDERFGAATVDSVELFAGNARVFISLSSLDPNASVILPIEVSLTGVR